MARMALPVSSDRVRKNIHIVKGYSPHYRFSDGAFLQEVAHLGKHVRHCGDVLEEL
jgi:hypothetical protein